MPLRQSKLAMGRVERTALSGSCIHDQLKGVIDWKQNEEMYVQSYQQ